MDLIEHPVKFISSLNNSVSVVAVHDKDQTLRVLEVVPPQGTDLRTKSKSSVKKILQHSREINVLQLQKIHEQSSDNWRSDLVLTPDIPHSETDVLVLHSFHIETCKR